MKKKSTKAIWGLLLLFFCSSCIQSYIVSDPYRIDDFPTPPHENKVQVFFQGEQPASSEYIRTHLFEAHSSHGATYASLVKELQERAEEQSVDAIIIFTPESYFDSGIRILTGVGIKFKANVDYLHKYRLVDQLYLYNLEEKEFRQIANLYPDFNNQIFQYEAVDGSQLAGYYYDNFIQKYSIPFLLEDQSSLWVYNYNSSTGLINRRTYRNTQTTITVSPEYKKGQIKQLEVIYRFPDKPIEKRYIALTFDEQNLLTEKIIKNPDQKPLLKEIFQYDEHGKFVQSIYYRLEEDQEIPFLKTNYFYYENEDIYTYF